MQTLTRLTFQTCPNGLPVLRDRASVRVVSVAYVAPFTPRGRSASSERLMVSIVLPAGLAGVKLAVVIA